MSERSNDRRGPISLAALVTFIAGLGVFFGVNNQESTVPVPAPQATTAEAPAPEPAPEPDSGAVEGAEDVSAGLEECRGLEAGSAEQRECAGGVVGEARSALVDGVATGVDPASLEGLWQDHATAVALALGPDDDPSVVFPEGALPAPSSGPSANTVACTPAAGTRRNLGVPGTQNRPSALAVAVCEDDGAVALVALFRKSGGYYADGVGTKVCTGARCAVQAPSNNRCGRYRSYVVVYNRNANGEAGPVSDRWSPENLYCNPRAA
jgi:hypothetical protein